MKTEDKDTARCANGVAKALLRDHLERQEQIDRKMDDLEMRMASAARRAGMREDEIQQFLRRK